MGTANQETELRILDQDRILSNHDVADVQSRQIHILTKNEEYVEPDHLVKGTLTKRTERRWARCKSKQIIVGESRDRPNTEEVGSTRWYDRRKGDASRNRSVV